MNNGFGQVVHDEGELRRLDVLDVLQRARVEVVDADHAVAVGEQRVAHVGTEKSRSAGDDAGTHSPPTIPAGGRRDGRVGIDRGMRPAAPGPRRRERPRSRPGANGRPSSCCGNTSPRFAVVPAGVSICPADADDALQRAIEILLTKAPPHPQPRLAAWMHLVTRREAPPSAGRARAPAVRPLAADPEADEPEIVERVPSPAPCPAERYERVESARCGPAASPG